MTGCTVTGCEGALHARGYCHAHYQRWWRYRDVNEQRRVGRRILDLEDPTPLVCDCPTPTPTPTDQCDRCKRVIAEAVHARRATR